MWSPYGRAIIASELANIADPPLLAAFSAESRCVLYRRGGFAASHALPNLSAQNVPTLSGSSLKSSGGTLSSPPLAGTGVSAARHTCSLDVRCPRR